MSHYVSTAAGWGTSSPAGIPGWLLSACCSRRIDPLWQCRRLLWGWGAFVQWNLESLETTSLLFCRNISIKTFALKSIAWALCFALCSLAAGKDEIPCLTITRSCASLLSLQWRLEPGMRSPPGSAFPSEHPSAESNSGLKLPSELLRL